MQLSAGNIYHFYNRGNNSQLLFFQERNYIFFLEKVRKYLFPHCEIIAYVLMPNHFHFLIQADERTELSTGKTSITGNAVSEGFRLLLSAYTKGINKQEQRTGNLLQQNTRSKCVYDKVTDDMQYAHTCFHYIHQNPLRAGFVTNISDWHYSSYRDYAGLRNGTLVNKQRTASIFGASIGDLVLHKILPDESLKNIW